MNFLPKFRIKKLNPIITIYMYKFKNKLPTPILNAKLDNLI